MQERYVWRMSRTVVYQYVLSYIDIAVGRIFSPVGRSEPDTEKDKMKPMLLNADSKTRTD